MVSPWAQLGVAMAEVVAMIEPEQVIPPIVVGRASLNLFIGLVGHSSAGKSGPIGAARDCFNPTDPTVFMPTNDQMWADRIPIGTGQGLAAMFVRVVVITGSPPTMEKYRTRALITATEYDGIASQMGVSGSNLSEQLRKIYSGETIGNFIKDPKNRTIAEEHTYRACLVTGIQPKKAKSLLDEQDGGLPQRFLWMPTDDPDAPDELEDEPEPMHWQPPAPVAEIFICQSAINETVRLRRLALKGKEDPGLEGHKNLTRIKVGIALAILNGRLECSEDDWYLAGLVMDVSDATRAECVAMQHDIKKAVNESVGVAKAHQDEAYVEAKAKINTEGQTKVATKILELLGTVDEWVAHHVLKKRFGSAKREIFDETIQDLVDDGRVISEAIEYQGQPAQRYRMPRSS